MDQEQNKKQNRKVTLFACLLSFLSIGLLVFGFTLVSSDKVVMLQSISNLSSRFNQALDSDSLLLDKISSSNNVGIRLNMNTNYQDSTSTLLLDYLENKEDKKSRLDFTVSKENEKILDLDMSLYQKNLYFFIENITPSYYYTAFNYYSLLSSLSSSDSDKLLSLLKESVTDYIDNDSITSQKVNITYHGKSKKVNKLTYQITNKTVYDILASFIHSVQTDTSLYNNVSSYLKLSKEELDEKCNQLLTQIGKDNKTVLYNYRVYYYGFNQIVSYELEDVINKVVLKYQKDDKDILEVKKEDTVVLSINISKNKNQYDFEGFINSDKKYDFTGNIKNNTITVFYHDNEDSYQFSLTLKKDIKDNSFSYDYDINVLLNKETVFISKINFTYYFNKKIEDINYTNSTSISDITEEDFNTILEQLKNHPLYDLISSFTDKSLSL
ncbi:hypothetical protein EGW03_05575 [bacterium]|nr:hypothetical protein [bacterium]